MTRAMAAITLLVLAGAAAAQGQDRDARADTAEAPEPEPAPVRIYIPRSVAAEGDVLRLGQITVVRCEDETLAAKVSAIPMGRGPWPTERIAFARQIILSRLATHGVAADRVRVTGAKAVSVVGRGQTVPAADIVARAEQFLKDSGAIPAGQWVRLASRPRRLVLNHRGKVTLMAALAKDSPPNHVAVLVLPARGSARGGPVKVLFRRIYSGRRAVAAKEIAPGQTITADNTRVETVATETRPDPSWSPPYGLTATRRIKPGAVVHAAAARAKRQPALVRRNQNVTMRITADAFTITGTGVALQDGRAGESIRVRNIDSQRIITARVNGDGTVEPSFEEPGT